MNWLRSGDNEGWEVVTISCAGAYLFPASHSAFGSREASHLRDAETLPVSLSFPYLTSWGVLPCQRSIYRIFSMPACWNVLIASSFVSLLQVCESLWCGSRFADCWHRMKLHWCDTELVACVYTHWTHSHTHTQTHTHSQTATVIHKYLCTAESTKSPGVRSIHHIVFDLCCGFSLLTGFCV